MCFTITIRNKKKYRNIIIILFFLLGGVEYGVIIPTLWLYLQHTYNASESFYSIVLSAYSFSSLVSSPIFGTWIDYRRTTKMPLIIGLFIQIGGNFLYFVAPTKYLVLIARLLCGVGDGAGAVLITQIVRESSLEERTEVLSLALAARQIGSIIGPSLNLVLTECHFYIGPFIVNNYRSPGILMAVLWAIVLLLVVFLYYDSPVVKSSREINIQVNGPGKAHGTRNISYWKELLNEGVIVILFTQFVIFFNTFALEALVAPMMEHLLGWKTQKNSILYSLIGVEGIVGYIVIGKTLSKRISDRWLIVCGLAVETVAVVLYMIVLAPAKPYSPVILPTVIVGTIIIVLGLPFIIAGGVSLFSKITSEESQGLSSLSNRHLLLKRAGDIIVSNEQCTLYRVFQKNPSSKYKYMYVNPSSVCKCVYSDEGLASHRVLCKFPGLHNETSDFYSDAKMRG